MTVLSSNLRQRRQSRDTCLGGLRRSVGLTMTAGLLGACLLFPDPALAQDWRPAGEAGEAPRGDASNDFDYVPPFKIHGELRLDARMEWVEASRNAGAGSTDVAQAFSVSPSRHRRDTDLFGYLNLHADHVYSNFIDLKFSARAEWDIQGDPFRYEYADFRDENTGNRFAFKVREGYAFIRVLGPKNAYRPSEGNRLTLTGGRFFVHEVEWGLVDGAMIEGQGDEISFAMFGGARGSHYDRRVWKRMLGGHVTYKATDTLALTLSDVLHIDNSLEGSARYAANDWMLLYGAVKFVNDDIDVLRTSADIDFDDMGLSVFIGYRSVFDRNDKYDYDYTEADTQVSRTRFQRLSFNWVQEAALDDYEIKIYKSLGETFGLYLAGRRLEVKHDDDRDEYNRDFWEGSLGFDLHDLPLKGSYAESRVTYTDFNYPSLAQGVNFDDVRGEGERWMLEWYNHMRVSLLYRKLSVGAEVIYRTFDYKTRFLHLENLRQWAFAQYIMFRPDPDVKVRLDYYFEQGLEVVDADIAEHHGLRLQVRYSF